jgi:hypothetical protein
LHTTPGIPEHVQPEVALVTAGVGMDVLGLAYSEYSDAERKTVVHAKPRSAHFKEEIIQAFHQAQTETTFGNVKAKTVADQFAETLAAAGVKRGTSLRESKSPKPSPVWS